jgi:hemerythrin-like domain-containing protein
MEELTANNNTTKDLTSTDNTRRRFIEKSFKIALFTGIAGVGMLSSCKEKEESEDKEVSPPEDLMQEHGVLNRILLIYDTCRIHLINKEIFSVKMLTNSADIIRTFVEDYHEKQEENYLFPRFEKANQLTDLVQVLRQQHKVGRLITDQVTQLSKIKTLTDNENQKLIKLLTDFNTMYRPHEAREDTVLFPAFRKLVSKNEYDSLGEEFEENEHKMFGQDGFETVVTKVTEIEKALGIYELAQFTPKFEKIGQTANPILNFFIIKIDSVDR